MPGLLSSSLPVCGLTCPAACGIFVPWPGVEPMSPALEGRLSTTVLSVQFNIVNIEASVKFNIVVLHKGLHDLPSPLSYSLPPTPLWSPNPSSWSLWVPHSGMLFPHLLGSSPITPPITLFNFLFFLFIYMYLVGCGESWLQHVGSSFLTRDWTWAPALIVRSLNCWPTREVLHHLV